MEKREVRIKIEQDVENDCLIFTDVQSGKSEKFEFTAIPESCNKLAKLTGYENTLKDCYAGLKAELKALNYTESEIDNQFFGKALEKVKVRFLKLQAGNWTQKKEVSEKISVKSITEKAQNLKDSEKEIYNIMAVKLGLPKII